jgi:protocatechuate 3,4-dioxygenase beta subunit
VYVAQTQLAMTFAALLAVALPAHAQVVGQIQGTVTDAQGAVLPGVSLTVRNIDTGARRTTVSEGDGQYRFAGLQPGTMRSRRSFRALPTLTSSG